jgi:hypothetical protein
MRVACRRFMLKKLWLAKTTYALRRRQVSSHAGGTISPRVVRVEEYVSPRELAILRKLMRKMQ